MNYPARVLILSASHLCRNPRVLKEATTLGNAGHAVTLLSVSTHAHYEQTDRALMRGLPFKRLTLDYTSRRPTARAAYFIQRSATWIARRLLTRWGMESARCLGPAAGALLRQAQRQPADLIITHTEIPVWAAQSLQRAGRRVAVDLEDWHSEDLLPADRRHRPLRLLRRAEQFALQQAAYVSVPSASMADALHQTYGGTRPIVVRNTFPLQPDPRPQRSRPAATPRFIWFSQTVGPGRGLEPFLAAWGLTRQPSQVCLLGDAQPDYREHLRALVPAGRRADLSFLAPVPPDQLPGLLADYDLGLALEASTPISRDVTITNKIFQYLNAGLAALATGTRGQREVLQAAPACGRLIQLENPTALAAELDALIADPDQIAAMQQAARTAAEQQFSWEHEEARLLAAVARALAR